jgi:alpha-D-ribose 1-methylphosphonate 5-triphosphate synthase subunit PhnH
MSIAAALIDLETSYSSPDTDLMERLATTGGRSIGSDAARYQFYPTLGDDDILQLRRAPIGSHLYPDDSATLIIGCRIGSGQQMVWSGPGINGSATLELDGVSPAFWQLRADAIRYPLGWDVFFVAGDQVIGLPRTTLVEVR